jgi:hypothetical protein
MICMHTYPLVGLGARTGLTGFDALSGFEGWHTAVANVDALGSVATFAWRCTG